jgi:hypothetical protein
MMRIQSKTNARATSRVFDDSAPPKKDHRAQRGNPGLINHEELVINYWKGMIPVLTNNPLNPSSNENAYFFRLQ